MVVQSFSGISGAAALEGRDQSEKHGPGSRGLSGLAF